VVTTLLVGAMQVGMLGGEPNGSQWFRATLGVTRGGGRAGSAAGRGGRGHGVPGASCGHSSNPGIGICHLLMMYGR
ncbi:hypothetical protein ACWEV4_34355, partial [Streptomyces sp. NPDC003860]